MALSNCQKLVCSRHLEKGLDKPFDSPIHLLTRSEELALKNVLLASVATVFARYDFPVPSGPSLVSLATQHDLNLQLFKQLVCIGCGFGSM